MRTKILTAIAALSLSVAAQAQVPELPDFPFFKPTANDSLVSTEVTADGDVIMRIYAPEAETVSVGGDLGGFGPSTTIFTKDERGVWEGVAKGLKQGVYRYHFVVDGVTVNDPKADATKDCKPLLEVDPDGNAFWAMKDVPHGATAEVYYPSSTFGKTRRMHVWTPAGYNRGDQEALPVLYLIHGGGDNDFSWAGVGRANFILDNLLAEGKIVPMLVVMPDGSVDLDGFTAEMMTDIIPYIEANYNVKTDADHRALAGLSMGGLETLEISLTNYKHFAYVFPLSTGWFIGSPFFDKWDPYIKEHAEAMNSQFKVYKFYMGGESDIAYKNCIATREVFTKYGVKHTYSSMEGGHSWYVWRHNLYDLAQLLFK